MTIRFWLVLALAAPSAAVARQTPVELGEPRPTCDQKDPNDQVPDSAALQDCLDRGGRIELEAGEPGYILDRGLRLQVPGTVLTSAGPTKARLLAHPSLHERMLHMEGDHYELSRVIVDGNLPERQTKHRCEGYRGFGSNLFAAGEDFRIEAIESIRAMCGSGMEVEAKDFVIADSVFAYNGRDAAQAPRVPEPWADGLTLLRCERGRVHHNAFIDNTDISLISGGGGDCVIEHNTVEQSGGVYAYAGLMIHNFSVGGAGKGDHAGSVLRHNTVRAAIDTLGFGLAIGPHTWADPSLVVSNAGEVHENTISGAFINLAIDGIEDGRIWANELSEPQGTKGIWSCRKSANYTAGHFGRASVNRGYVGRSYDTGDCLDEEVPGDENGAEFAGQLAPERLVPGEKREVRVSFTNTGRSAWTEERRFRLGAQSPRDNGTWGRGRVFIEPGVEVPPGESYTFRFAIRAPSEPGTYQFQWRMLEEYVEWFGQPSPVVTVLVAAPAPLRGGAR